MNYVFELLLHKIREPKLNRCSESENSRKCNYLTEDNINNHFWILVGQFKPLINWKTKWLTENCQKLAWLFPPAMPSGPRGQIWSAAARLSGFERLPRPRSRKRRQLRRSPAMPSRVKLWNVWSVQRLLRSFCIGSVICFSRTHCFICFHRCVLGRLFFICDSLRWCFRGRAAEDSQEWFWRQAAT